MKPTVTSSILLIFSYWICNVSSFTLSSRRVHGSIASIVVPQTTKKSYNTQSFLQPYLCMSTQQEGDVVEKKQTSKLPFLLDPGTKGGAVFLSLVLFIVPILGYQIITEGMGVDSVEAGKWIGVGFTVITLLLWAASYIFRVATKDMTYAKQLKDYENAVIAKRLQELDSDEVQALMEDIERDDF